MFSPSSTNKLFAICYSGTKHVDPDTGIIYFKYDFGYEFGIIFPGEGKKIVGGIRNGSQQSEKNRVLPPRTSDIEMPIIHEKSNGRASVVSFGATGPIEFEKNKKRYSLPSPNFYDRLTPKPGAFQTSGILIKFTLRVSLSTVTCFLMCFTCLTKCYFLFKIPVCFLL